MGDCASCAGARSVPEARSGIRFGIKDDELGIKNDEICIKIVNFALMMDFGRPACETTHPGRLHNLPPWYIILHYK